MEANGKQHKKPPLAIFDIDGTIFRSSLTLELCFALVGAGVLPRNILQPIKRKQRAWMDREGSYEEYILTAVRQFTKTIRGKRAVDVRRVARSVILTMKKRVYRYTRDLIHSLRDKYHLVAISGSPQEIVEEFNKHWRFNHAFGSMYEVGKNGLYTGKVLLDLGKVKKQFLLSYIKTSGHSLRHSIGVGDTVPDASFLTLVDKPIAFNPNASLYQIAKRRGWTIVVERKDMTYELS